MFDRLLTRWNPLTDPCEQTGWKLVVIRLIVLALMGAALALVTFGSKADGAEKCPRKPRKTIIVTDNIPPEMLPALVAKMTPKQFEAYAKQRNEEALAKAKLNHEAYLAARGPLRSATLIETGGTQTTRYGGGAGYNGVGGNGGYLGYHNNILAYNGGNNGFIGLGMNFAGNMLRTSESSYDRTFRQEFPDLNDAGGGGITLINPFCFDYWRRHTEPE